MIYPPSHKSWRMMLEELPEATQEDILSSYPDYVAESWNFNARREQLSPEKNWSIWLCMAGRGAGKTRSGAEWINNEVKRGVERIALVAPTAGDARDVMIEGESGIIATSLAYMKPHYEVTKRRLTWPNGAMATVFSAEEPERLRGPQQEIAWCDEIATWRYLQRAWDNLLLGTRLGKRARILATTTPRPIKLIKTLVKRSKEENSSVVLSTGSTYDNLSNLAPMFAEEILSTYEGTRLGRQEIGGELLEDYEGALWSYTLLDSCRVTKHDDLVRVVVALDPSVTSGPESDEAGIVAAGVTAEKLGVVLADASMRGKPSEWARRTIRLYKEHEADCIVAEKNQGGEMITEMIHNIDSRIKVKLVHASRGKITRAEPIATAYEQGMIKHKGTFPQLEDEMCSYVPGEINDSPNRMDALVWAMNELIMGKRKRAGAWGRRRAA